MQNPIIKAGMRCIIQYWDAAYAFNAFDEKEEIPAPNPNISIGQVRRITDEFIDLSVIWEEREKDVYTRQGIIIPRGGIITIYTLE